MTTEAASYFSRELLGWYLANKRDLPWRMNRDPYRVWVSEIMLQQTRVDTVIPYYERFLEKFPTASALANAPEPEVLKCWEGLGYYSRARNLQAGAREVVARHGGAVPDDKEAVSALRGVGPYTTGAIMSIAFNRPEPAVDGNVMRVLSRYFCLEEDIAKPATRIGIEKLAASLIPEGSAGDFNQALMELGALVCTPKSPGCLTCPVMMHCEGRMAGKEHVLPIKTKAKPPRRETRIAALITGSGEHAGKLLVRQRPESGLLAQMWELPHVLAPDALGAAAPAKRRGRSKAGAALNAAAVAGELQLAAPEEASAIVSVSVSEASAAVRESAAGSELAAFAEPLLHAGTAGADGPPDAGGSSDRRASMADFLSRALSAEDGLLVRPEAWWGETDHVFSHIVWDMQVFRAEFGFWQTTGKVNTTSAAGEAAADEAAGTVIAAGTAGTSLFEAITEASAPYGDDRAPAHYRWIGPEEMRTLAFPNVFIRILQDYWRDLD
ncbi:A/G-specific adenine glycosylase [Paenibacillus sacheonensis]|uniref:Adenine DNA glycosylase n=1 Tax=Paenibacillus sacheonensis TaxID=742054 RepID=A0A7X4YSZ9_9BACL|nr:A/G-specific adenine glycosylase [Paenibacillus sacheonensis]MBM7567714.1 A/G-specific adenine glycosylase [Paenibacillus sacheonensis]NBC72011.1 A/G-specific adenine glycosylase [Paenibacillus sacheonensis]